MYGRRGIVAERGTPRWFGVAVLAVVTGALVLAATAFAMSPDRSAPRAQPVRACAQCGVSPGGGPPGAARDAESAAKAFRVVSISPGNSADPVTAADPVRVRFSGPLAYLPLTSVHRHGLRGSMHWQGTYPVTLTRQWRPRRPGVVLAAALMAFQADHRLPMTGIADSALWQALLAAAAKDRRDPHGYTYALVDKALPETLTIWHDGHVVMRTLASTGSASTPTADGTFPVYLRHRFQVMRGIMPDGSPYADPVHYVAFFNGGDAVHSFRRIRYGTPHSLGCVELPLAMARKAWNWLSYGSLVTVIG
jgi:lipoprotein-anchoring transpeptidase ErfK/SrfK